MLEYADGSSLAHMISDCRAHSRPSPATASRHRRLSAYLGAAAGPSLLTPRAPLVPEEDVVLHVVFPLLEALVALHGVGVAHRDLKPANLVRLGHCAGDAWGCRSPRSTSQ